MRRFIRTSFIGFSLVAIITVTVNTTFAKMLTSSQLRGASGTVRARVTHQAGQPIQSSANSSHWSDLESDTVMTPTPMPGDVAPIIIRNEIKHRVLIIRGSSY